MEHHVILQDVGVWLVSGPCSVDGNCVQSPNYPDPYGHFQHCTISPPGPINAVDFETETGHDFLIVGSTQYHGTNGPMGITAAGDITWTSDGSVASKGWKLCTACHTFTTSAQCPTDRCVWSGSVCQMPPQPTPTPPPTPAQSMPLSQVMTCPTTPVTVTQCMDGTMYNGVVAEVVSLLRGLPDTCTSSKCPKADVAGCILRMSGHDFMDFNATTGDGGADGCTDMNHHDNAGLMPCLSTGDNGVAIQQVYRKFCDRVSLADFLVIAAEAVMTETRRIAIDGTTKQMNLNFEVNFKFGRTTRASCPGAADRLPNPENGCADVDKVFVKNLGLTRSQAAALMGVHTLGRAQHENSGYEGWWSDPVNSRKFNNNYFASMLVKGWMVHRKRQPQKEYVGPRR